MFYMLTACLLAMAPLAASESDSFSHESHHIEIDADTLHSWYEQNVQMTVFDARSTPYFDGALLPNATWVPADVMDEELIESKIPTKDSLVVVYCHGLDCPASGWLYDKLLSLGYTNIYEYPLGIDDWIERGYPYTESDYEYEPE